MYNEKLIEMSKIYKQFKDATFYKIDNIIFRIMDTEEEYISWRYDYDIFWNWGKSESFYNRMVNPIQLTILSKRPKNLKGKKKIATINKDKEWKIQVFIDDDYNLYYQDNHAFVSRINGELTGCKAWFKISSLYERRDYHIIDLLNEVNKISEKQYYKNNVTDNIALSRLYESMLLEYLKYIKEI